MTQNKDYLTRAIESGSPWFNIEEAPKGIPVLVEGGLAMRKTGDEWYSGMEEPLYQRQLQWTPKGWMPIDLPEQLAAHAKKLQEANAVLVDGMKGLRNNGDKITEVWAQEALDKAKLIMLLTIKHGLLRCGQNQRKRQTRGCMPSSICP